MPITFTEETWVIFDWYRDNEDLEDLSFEIKDLLQNLTEKREYYTDWAFGEENTLTHNGIVLYLKNIHAQSHHELLNQLLIKAIHSYEGNNEN